MGFLFREGQARRDDEKRRAGNEILEVQRERFFGKLGNASRSRPKEIFFGYLQKILRGQNIQVRTSVLA